MRCSSANAGSCNKTISYCQNPSISGSVPCIEVNLALSMYWSRGNNHAGSASVWERKQSPDIRQRVGVHGRHRFRPPDALVYVALLLFSIVRHSRQILFVTTTTLPRSITGSMSPGGNPAITHRTTLWPNTNAAWSVYPNAFSQPGGAGKTGPNHCAQTDPKGVQLTTCTLVLGGFDLYPVATSPQHV